MKRIFFMLLPVALMVLAFRANVSQDVSGRVSDENGNAIAGVTVAVKGTRKGVVTDATGFYQLSVPSKNTILVFSAVGYKTKEVKVGDNLTMNIVLELEEDLLQEMKVSATGLLPAPILYSL